MSDALKHLGSRFRSARLFLAIGMAISMVGCSGVPDAPDGTFDPLLGLGSKARQEAFEKQVQNDPFPTAGRVGL